MIPSQHVPDQPGDEDGTGIVECEGCEKNYDERDTIYCPRCGFSGCPICVRATFCVQCDDSNDEEAMRRVDEAIDRILQAESDWENR